MTKYENIQEEMVSNKILTLPNVISIFRIALIPLFVWLYLSIQAYFWTAVILIFSGITDAVDGYIARRFNAISNLGKVLDPIADKLTQIVALICLLTQFPNMLIPLILMIFKELFVSITGMLVIQNTGEVTGAKWHGKMTTVLFYVTIVTHVIWYDIPSAISHIFTSALIIMLITSLVLYGIFNIQVLKNTKSKSATKKEEEIK
ncbi:CDP-alcohol phosphatidyltransferase family protein [Amphibacillus sp. Q70]|uniref:CDP-alcohol phosphatidyltransferase family protein n=1 Tax=Amphibacillus sp. Q70 TaxID=3453416 RepID=UPI003F857B1B